jgi:hypothetical protein
VITLKRLLWCSMAAFAAACPAAEVPGPSAPTQTRQVMIYFRQALGQRGASRVYGVRLEQATLPSSSPSAPLVSSVRRRELINLEIAPHADLHLAFGRRLIWDISRQQFAIGALPAATFRLWTRPGAVSSLCQPALSCLDLRYSSLPLTPIR